MTPETAFSPAFSRQSFLETVGAADALQRLEAGLGAREPFLVLTGEPGSGKTTLVHEAIARWESRVAAAVIAYPALTGAELLEEIALRFGGQPADGASRPKLMACLERSLAEVAAQDKVAMVVVDDAHKLTPELLEDLRLLVNAAQQAGRPLEVLLAGLPDLETRLDDPALAALRQRVSVRARLDALPAGETRRYVRHRVDAAGGDGANLFPRKSCNEIAAHSLGLPRRINALAAAALRLARAAGGATVEPEHVRAAAASLWGPAPVRVLAERDDAEDADSTASAATVPAENSAKRAAAPPEHSAVPRIEASPARRPTMADAPLGDADVAPRPAPTSHDPNEWVQRFVGDRGPIRIGSQAMSHFAATRALPEAGAEGAAAPSADPPARVSAPAHAHGPSRRRRGRGVRVARHALLAACMVIAAVVLLVRAGRNVNGRSVPAAVATIDTLAPPRAGAGTRAARPAVKPAATPRPVKVVSTARDAAPQASPAMTSPTGRYTLAVGQARDLQDAFYERDRLQELTGFEGWVVPAPEGSGEPHRIVVGVYRSHARAEGAARMLMRSNTLPSVSVVPLPKRSARL